MSRGDSPSIEQVVAARKEQVSKEATNELQARKALDSKGGVNSQAKQDIERAISDLEQFRAKVAEIETFVKDPVNAELIKANPNLVLDLESKKQQLTMQENLANNNLLKSPAAGDEAVRTEMRAKYLSAYTNEYIGPVTSVVTEKSMYSYEKPKISLDTFQVADQVERIADYEMLSEKLSNDGLKDDTILGEISQKVMDRADKAIADFVIAYPKALEDSEELKTIYKNMRTEAGLPALDDGEDGNTLNYKNKSVSLRNHTPEGMRKNVEHAQQDVVKDKKIMEMAKQIKKTKGFLGFGTLNKKNAQVDELVRFGGSVLDARFDRSSPATIDASADAVVNQYDGELADDEYWVSVVEVAQKGHAETNALSTPVNVLENLERVRAAKAKFEQGAKQS